MWTHTRYIASIYRHRALVWPCEIYSKCAYLMRNCFQAWKELLRKPCFSNG